MSYDLIVIGSYPRQGQIHGAGTVGGAMCTKNTLLAITQKKPSLKTLVLAESLPGQPQNYDEANIHIFRCWQINRPFSIIALVKHVLNYPKTTPILVEFEMAMFGSPLVNALVPLLTTIFKLFGYKVTFVLHQVVLDFNEISGHIGQPKNSPVNYLLSLFSKIFYWLIVALSSKIIVFEQFLKDRLGNDKKIILIPLGVETVKTHHNTSLPKKEFVVTVFGFLAWYKGTDWIVKVFSQYFDRHPKSKFKLVIAGGPNPNHLDKPYYQKYLAQINNFVSKYPKKIIVTGFVPESKITEFYSQSDVIVLPYRVGMSSSGPLSLAFTYHKPFLVSQKISPILQTADISLLVSQKDVEFELTAKSLLHALLTLQNNPAKIKTLSDASRNISLSRSWSNISLQYLKCLEL